MPHIVRSSERLAARRCKRAWDWSWREGWQPIVVPQALEFGTGFHAGFQAIYEPSRWNITTPAQKLELAITAFTDCCNEQRDRYLAATSQTRMTWDGKDDYASRVELGIHMLEYYALTIHPVEDKNIRPVKTETKFQVPLFEPGTGEPIRCWNSPHCGQNHDLGDVVVHEGRVDAIFENTENGGYYIVDWKTIGGDKAIDGNEKNTNRFSQENLVWSHDQLGTYCWALRYVMKLDVRGFILAEIRKDYPKPPAKLRRKRNGGIFSQDKNMSTTYDVYFQTVRDEDFDGLADGAYDDFLEFLQSDEAPIFHKRFQREKTPIELQEIGRNVSLEVQDMVDKNVRIWAAPGPITCPRCAFRAPCEMKMRGFDYQFTLESDYAKESRYE